MARHNINVSDEVWRIASGSGNASSYIEQAVKAQYLSEIRGAANSVVTALPQSEIDDWMAWGSSIVDRAAQDRQ